MFYIYVYDKKKVFKLCNLLLYYFKIYRCKCYISKKSKANSKYQNKHQNHNTKAQISFLVKYELINNYKI